MADFTELSPLRDILGPTTRAASQSFRRRPAPTLDEEEERSLIQNLRDKSLTTLGVIGNTLDLPGSMIRDLASTVATGKFVNPLDQLLSPFSSENRTTGKQLLEQTGLSSGRESWGKSIAGFGLEVATDPLTYMTLGASALGKAGQAAKKAGVLDEAARAAARKQGRAVGTVGKREARLTTSIEDIARYGVGDAQQRAQKLMGTLTPEEAAKPLGGLVGRGLPFKTPSNVYGTGKKSVALAKGIDALGRAVAFGKIPGTDMLNPIGATLKLFNAPRGGANTAEGAAHAAALHSSLPRSYASQKLDSINSASFVEGIVKDKNSSDYAELANAVDSSYWMNLPWMAGKTFDSLTDDEKLDAASDVVREAIEGFRQTGDVPKGVEWLAPKMRADYERATMEQGAAGGIVRQLVDSTTEYAPRYASSSKKLLSSKDMEASTFDPSQGYARLDFLNEIEGGTVALKRKVIMDPEVRRLVESKAGADDLRDYLERTHSGWMSDNYTSIVKSGKKKGQPVVKKGRYKKLADMLYKQDPEVLSRGLFGNSVFFDHAARMMGHTKSVETLKGISELLTEKDASGAARYIKSAGDWANEGVNVGAADDKTVKMLSFLKKMDLAPLANYTDKVTGQQVKGGMLRVLGQQLGVDPKDLKNFRIDKRIAEDLINIHKAATSRDTLDEILEMTDYYTNFSKALLTGVWPSFHVRNLVSGFTQNAMLGMYDNESARWAYLIQRGEVLPGAAKVEFAAEEYAKRAKSSWIIDSDIKDQLVRAGYSQKDADRIVTNAPAPTRRPPTQAEKDADDLVSKIMSGGAMPAMITSNLRRIAAGVGVNITPTMTPIDVVEAIRKERSFKASVQPIGDFDDKFATEVLGQRAYADGVVGSFDADRVGSVAGTAEQGSGTFRQMMSAVPRPGYKTISPYRVAAKALGLEPGTTIHPKDWGKIRGIGGRLESEVGPVVAGEEIGHFVEGSVRLSGYFNLLKKGYTPEEAAKKVAAAQVAYSNRNFTPFETKYMTRLMPFYKFSRSQIPFQFKQLIEKPGGPQAQLFRALNTAQSQGELAPDYVRDTASIPVSGENPLLQTLIGAPPEGTDRYVSGFGLMAEDLLSVGPGVRGTGQEALSRLNPLIKGPLEYFTNQSFFQAGPEGGRPLDEMDPLIGRTLANLAGREDPVPTNPLLESIAANSPFSRFLTTARTLTDPRKAGDYGAVSEALPINLPGVPAMLNLLTGVRVTDVSPGAKDAIVRDLMNAQMKATGAKAFENINYTKADLAEMSPAEREAALALQALRNKLVRDAKQRAKAQEQNK